MKLPLPLVTAAVLFVVNYSHAQFSEEDYKRIGDRVWQNECGRSRDGLTSWNAGENFASLGIGHFIWYPKGVNGPFEESFPQLLRFYTKNAVALPGWLKLDTPCPWATRAEFQSEFNRSRMKTLRDFLANTVWVQSKRLVERMEQAQQSVVQKAPSAQQANIRAQFARLKATRAGVFALIDYVNFKGEGTKLEERYNREGWGLMQVLAEMKGNGAGAPAEFARCAAAVLERRVKNSPPERNEARWLPGWRNRVRAYAE